MPLRIRESGGITILDIEGNIDINSSEIIETVGWLINSGKINILVNLENVDLVDYSGLSILAIAYKNVVNHKGKLKFLKTPLSVIELFKVVRLEAVFELYTDEEEAIKSFYDEGVEQLRLRRKFKRLDIHLRVRYRIVGGQKNPKSFEGDVLNISAAGIYIYSPYTFPMNSVVDMEITLHDPPLSLETQGRVIWLADKDLQLHAYPGMGVSFVHLTPEREKAIIDFIDKNITNRAEPI
ncbi:MAG: PilZ domain-containing protein [Candidatus Omnitrophota bacterium]